MAPVDQNAAMRRRTHLSRCKAGLRVAGAGVLLCGALALASPLAARTVEFLQDVGAIRAAAADQGIEGPFSEVPASSNVQIVLETAQAADHRVTVASNYYQAFDIENPVSGLLQDLVSKTNPSASALADQDHPASVAVRIRSASTLLRCVGKSDVEIMCKNRVRITAETSIRQPDGSTSILPLVAEVERKGRVGGFCGNIARYTGIVTREAAIALVEQARSLARN